ncbi:MAG: carboxylating nicotinate-nucleotide diphosphorylase [Candidatus Fermentibacteraceae bacterium]|nr:carboxylating nicotinate-nucleotide diphosphorylase [Candidatus Fermentibacteraceae bacterium]MBN2609873.1 carboxylating nicotinate-nucleotide diphosphorylase [Candidatus Fermentibacteraceae bacterium]
MRSEVDWSDPVSVGEFITAMALEEDQALRDAATSSLGSSSHRESSCAVTAREELLVAGWFLLDQVFRSLAGSFGIRAPVCRQYVADGKQAETGAVIGSVEGPAHILLRGERVALNLLCRLSGIATLTREFVRAVRGTGVDVIDTRKTTPCLRALEKYAVRMGGGVNHRFDLAEMAMIKDNHLAFAGGVEGLGGIMERLRAVKVPVEIEVDSLRQLEKALAEKPGRILLDNMGTEQLREAVRLSAGSGVYLEASGGVTLDNIRSIAETGVNGISSGALTHSAPSADIGFDWGR